MLRGDENVDDFDLTRAYYYPNGGRAEPNHVRYIGPTYMQTVTNNTTATDRWDYAVGAAGQFIDVPHVDYRGIEGTTFDVALPDVAWMEDTLEALRRAATPDDYPFLEKQEAEPEAPAMTDEDLEFLYGEDDD